MKRREFLIGAATTSPVVAVRSSRMALLEWA
jgi:hypothetical protein